MQKNLVGLEGTHWMFSTASGPRWEVLGDLRAWALSLISPLVSHPRAHVYALQRGEPTQGPLQTPGDGDDLQFTQV